MSKRFDKFVHGRDAARIIRHWLTVLAKADTPYPEPKYEYVPPPVDLTVHVQYDNGVTSFSVGGGTSNARKIVIDSIMKALRDSGEKPHYLGGSYFTVRGTSKFDSRAKVTKALGTLIRWDSKPVPETAVPAVNVLRLMLTRKGVTANG